MDLFSTLTNKVVLAHLIVVPDAHNEMNFLNDVVCRFVGPL